MYTQRLTNNLKDGKRFKLILNFNFVADIFLDDRRIRKDTNENDRKFNVKNQFEEKVY